MNKKVNYYLLIVTLLPLVLYVILSAIISNRQACAFDETVLFDLSGEGTFLDVLLQSMVVLVGIFGVFISPGLSWLLVVNKKYFLGVRSIIFSFLTSMILVEGIVFLLRNVCLNGIGRTEFIFAVFFVTLLGAVVGLLRGSYFRTLRLKESILTNIGTLIIFIFAIGLIFVSFYAKIFIEDINNDGHEVFWHSLHLLNSVPYINLPELGYLKPMLGASFIALFGKSAAALRIPYFFYLALIYIVAAAIISHGRKIYRKAPFYILIGHTVLFTIFMFFQPYWEPYHVDVATVVADMPFLLLSLCFVYTLIKKQYTFSLITAALLLQCVHYAPVILMIMLGGYWLYFKKQREAIKFLFWKIVILITAGVILYLLHSWQFGYFKSWQEVIATEYFGRFSGTFSFPNTFGFIGQYALLLGGVPVIAMLLLWSKDRISNFVNFIAVVYLIILLSTPDKNVHNLTPIAFFPVISSLRVIYSITKTQLWLKIIKFSYCCVLIICIIFLWPLSYEPHTKTHEFWSKVQFIYPKDIVYIDDYVEDKVNYIFSDIGLSHIFSGS